MAVEPHERRFTVDEYYRMAEVGILDRDERVELVDGRIIAMSPIGSPHAWCVSRLNRILARRDDVIVIVQNPIHLDDRSEPEPDLAVLRIETPQDRHPRPRDVLLIVEVADTSLAYDRQTKSPLYARSNIPELWIVDLGGARVDVYLDPTPAGYRLVQTFKRGEAISPAFAPNLMMDVDAILGQSLSQTADQ
jgi:Uma2 family endonuclease